MDVRLQAKDGTVASLPVQIAAVTERLAEEQPVWRERLQREPSRFGEVEVAVHHAFQQMADQVVAGLLADVGQQPVLENAGKKSH
jgi:hypothetical protein